MLSLRSHPRIRRLVERAARRSLRAVGAKEAPTSVARRVAPGLLATEGSVVTNRLFESLEPTDVTSVENQISQDAHLALQYSTPVDEAARQQMILTFGAWLANPGLLERTGLSAAQPPDDVHAMARGPLAAAGGLYEADMVIDALMSAGVDITGVKNALDFGCSSARVVRVLAAAYPEVHWYGCDPNTPAIAWASENLPEIDFFVSGHAAPLPLGDASLDAVYAISIWSHFEPALGLRWFEEMRRVLRPGGHLVCTTHGLNSIAYYDEVKLRTASQLSEIAKTVYRLGWWYAQEFGEEGDWGVVNPDWGTAFLSPEWMLAQLCPRWRVLEFAPGRNQDNQDVYVLQRV
ncbi:MAG TPA: methyltransferase domain-containing protein [Solirubrobacteraceae bacterium]|nr:methyltransferase domain-containing protein [Solirubrobacteraceae bacterium]